MQTSQCTFSERWNVPSLVTALTGPAGSFKTDRLLQRYRTVLTSHAPGTALWLAPTARAAATIRSRLLGKGLDGCFAPGITTFARFAESILQRSPRTVRRLSGLLARQLVRQVVDEEVRQGRLNHFAPIASTGGLLDLLCNFIRQMKRLEIWPDQFAAACEQRGFTQKDRELLAIYRAYQHNLVEHDLYDAEGRLWSARDLLRLQPSGHRFVVADGFSDFTRTEHEMLEDLAAAGEETWITLPLEEESQAVPQNGGRPDLFQKSRKTLDELRRRHAGLQVEATGRLRAPPSDGTQGPPDPVWPAMDALERNVFANPRSIPPAPDTAGLEILAAGRQIGEIERIGRRIKRLLLDGDDSLPVRPGEIAVVFRHLQGVADLVEEVFQRLQIPFYLESGRSLDRVPAIAMLVRLLELDAEDWPVQKLLGVLESNYFAPVNAGQVGNVLRDGLIARTIRGLQIPRGRTRLLEEAAVSQQAGAEVTCKLLCSLADALDRLPQHDTLSAHAAAWTKLAEQTGILQSMSDADRAAWKQLQETLREGQQLAAWLAQENATHLDRNQAREALLDILRTQALSLAQDEPGRVRVLAAASARHLRTPYLFLAGLSEKSFPAADREDGVYSEAEHQRLIEAGLPLPSRSDRQTDEMLLFYETITSASRRLFLSYPSVNESGEPLTPSPYVEEVQQALGSTPIARVEQVDLSPVPGANDLCSADAFRIRAVFEAVQGKADRLAGLVQRGAGCQPSPPILSGLEFTLERQNRDRFGATEGILSPAASKSLQAEFPPERVYSATELERYAYCPYQFFLEKVLNVQPLDEIELEVDFMERGKTAHALLAALHRGINQLRGGAESPAALAASDYDRLLAEAVAETLVPAGRDGLTAALREIDRRKLLAWLAEYRGQHEKYDDQWADCDRPPRPAIFEVSFGKALREGDAPPSTAAPLEMVSGGEAVRLAGRIDRIDVGEVRGRPIFNILDYKTGKGKGFSLEACQRGTLLQLPLYALAAGELILADRDAVPWQGGYWYISGDGFKPKQALRMYELVDGHLTPSETWEAIRGILADTVVGLVRAIRQGQFPVWSDDPHCTGRCPYNTVCRINHIRSLEKKWQPPH
jgi:ATP-dependent helicase/nuclease subunit B